MKDLYCYSIIDGFFLTFLAAWIGVSQYQAERVSFISFTILFLGILFFSMIIIQLRYWINNRTIDKNTSLSFYLAIVLIMFIIVYFSWKEPMYLSSSDKSILLVSAFSWLAVSVLEASQIYVNFSTKK